MQIDQTSEMMTLDRPRLPDAFMTEAHSGFAGRGVVITGGSGFIGRRLVAALLELGAKVRVILRSGHGRKQFEAAGAEVAIGQLQAPEFLRTQFQDTDILFHLAYDIRASGRENLEVFAGLLEAAQASDLERIVHMSSLVVYDHWPDGIIDQHAAATRTGMEDYRDAKTAMEEALMAGSKPAAILQPGIVHGPGSALWTEAPRNALKRGPVILPDPIGLCPAVHVDDVVQAALRAALLADLGHERFILNGPDKPDWQQFYQAHIKAIGQGRTELQPLRALQARLPEPPPGTASSQGPSLAARVSKSLRHMLGRDRFERMTGTVKRLIGGSGPIYPDRNRLALYSARGEISDAHTRDRIGYDPQHGV